MNVLVSAVGFLLIASAGNETQRIVGTVLAVAGVSDVLLEYRET